MNSRAIDLRAKKNKRIGIKIIPGHFSTSHSHVNYYIDMTDIKSYYKKAKLAAEELAKAYSSTPVDVIICLEGTRIVGAYLAEELAQTSIAAINHDANLAVVTPETNANNQMIFRDSSRALVMVFKPSTLSCATITASGSARFTMPSSSGQSAQPVTSASTSFSSKHWRAKSINCSRSAPSPSQTIMLHIGGLLPVQIAFYTFSIGKKAAVFKGVAAT